MLFRGAMASSAATFVSHYPWFTAAQPRTRLEVEHGAPQRRSGRSGVEAEMALEPADCTS